MSIIFAQWPRVGLFLVSLKGPDKQRGLSFCFFSLFFWGVPQGAILNSWVCLFFFRVFFLVVLMANQEENRCHFDSILKRPTQQLGQCLTNRQCCRRFQHSNLELFDADQEMLNTQKGGPIPNGDSHQAETTKDQHRGASRLKTSCLIKGPNDDVQWGFGRPVAHQENQRKNKEKTHM